MRGGTVRVYTQLAIDRSWDRLAAFLARRFGVAVEPDWLESISDRMLAFIYETLSDDCFLVWMKSRLAERHSFDAGCREAPRVEFRTDLHVGFLGIWESEEELERLRWEYLPPREQEVARSKLFRTHLEPQPIDRVAARVAPEPS